MTNPDHGLITCTRLDNGQVRIDNADPLVWIDIKIIAQARNYSIAIHRDGTLTIGDINPVTYRITGNALNTCIEAELIGSEEQPMTVQTIKGPAWTRLAVDVLAMERHRPGDDPRVNADKWATCRRDAENDLAALLPLVRDWLAADIDEAARQATGEVADGLALAARIIRQET